MRYPTREGISIPITELELPPSELDLSIPHNFNNHHHEWTRRRMGDFAITQTLRDLERHQSVMPRDVHDWLHRAYDPPVFPTVEQAMREVMDAYDNNELLKVYLPEEGRYVFHPISSIHIKTLEAEYNALRR